MCSSATPKSFVVCGHRVLLSYKNRSYLQIGEPKSTSQLWGLGAYHSLSLIPVMAKLGHTSSPSIKLQLPWDEPQDMSAPGRPHTGTQPKQAFRDCHRSGTGSECSRPVTTALLKLACLLRKNSSKLVVTILSKQVSTKRVTESSNSWSLVYFQKAGLQTVT